MAGSSAHCGHDGGHHPAGILGELGLVLREPDHRHVGPRCPIHLGGMEDVPRPAWNQRFNDHSVPPAGQRNRGMFPPYAKECPSLCCLYEQIVDAMLPWVMLGLRNAPKLDTATSTAEVVFGTPLRIPGLCFQDEQSTMRSATEQLELARSNAQAFSPESLDLRHFKALPFVAKPLRTADFV